MTNVHNLLQVLLSDPDEFNIQRRGGLPTPSVTAILVVVFIFGVVYLADRK